MAIRGHYQHESVRGIKVGRFNAGINSNFIVYHLADTLIDTGPPNQWPEVKTFVDQSNVQRLLLTHYHEDHSGNAQRIADHCGLLPFAPELTQAYLSKSYHTPLFQSLIWGYPRQAVTQPLPERLEISGMGEMQVIPAPGHTPDLHCFFMPQQGWLFSGDLYIASKLKYLYAGENLEQLMLSIQRVLSLDFQVVFCPHKGIDPQGREGLQRKLHFLIELAADAQRLHQKGLSVSEIRDRTIGKEDTVAYLTRFGLSKRNLIKAALQVDLNLLQ